jgi:dipeptidyl aminopeptidase/acylaminoacyl peptidase
MTEIKPYGSWKSPITADLIVAGTIGLGDIALDGNDVYWQELRPSEAGRSVIIKYTDGVIQEINPAPFNTRTKVHEYGGGSYLVHQGIVYFSNFADQRIYRQNAPGEIPHPLTSEGKYRYANGIINKQNQRLICIREDHSGTGEAVNTIVSINLENGDDQQILASGQDFYASPTISPDGEKLAWLSWQHPDMPWDNTQLWLADLQNNSLTNIQLIAGGQSESVFQPQWSPDGQLYFVSDRTNWWNIYRYDPVSQNIENICEKSAEFGLPQWVFGMSTYGFTGDGNIVCTYTTAGNWYLGTIDIHTKKLTTLEIPDTNISQLQVKGEKVYFLGSSPTASTAVIEFDLSTKTRKILQKSSTLNIDPGYLSRPQSIEFPTANQKTAYAFFYPPQNQDYTAPANSKPPLVVKSHGGPTAATASTLNLRMQYWTSRGFAVLDVNYGGSTGYGREYRQRLLNQWGIVDVADCVNGAKYLADQGLVDGEKMAIAGGSAGGYTTLCALTFYDVFQAGASHYGIGDLEALAKDTHKFESRYLDKLIGPYPAAQNIYQERSPINYIEKLSCPVIFFQGLEDQVVPPNQAEMMVDALAKKGIPVAYVPFESEQHGFRKAENIKRAIEGEFYFYARIFHIAIAEEIVPVEIINLE